MATAAIQIAEDFLKINQLKITDYKAAETLFVKPVQINGKQEFQEVEDRISIPKRYWPDKEDKFYRSPKLKEKGKDDCFHVIASGHFSDIIAAKLLSGEETITVAAKRYKLNKLDETIDGYTRLRRELQISRFHRHENIVKFYEVFTEYSAEFLEKPTHLWLVTERMDHTLEKYFEHLRRNDETQEPVLRDLRHLGALLTQLLRPLDYLHQRGIMHRDVTPRNIGMNQKEFEIKLLDFGLARETNAKMDHSTNVDTPYIYKPLEVFMRARYDVRVDIWAVALVAIEMLGMKLFMPTGNDEEITQKIRKRGAENAVKDRMFQVMGVPEDRYQSVFGRPVVEAPCPNKLDEFLPLHRLDREIGFLKKADFQDLMHKMLDTNMENRLRADECLMHPFLRILNEKYEQRAIVSGSVQPRDDNAMKARNEKDKQALLTEMVDLQNQSLYQDENSEVIGSTTIQEHGYKQRSSGSFTGRSTAVK